MPTLFDDPKFRKELSAMQMALLDPLTTEAMEDSICSEIKKLIRRQKEKLLTEEKRDV